VRIGPNELHCNDVAFVDEIYAGGNRNRDKQAHYLGTVAGPVRNAAVATIDHDLHRVRRSAMNKFFSRQQIIGLEPEMLKLTQRLCDKFLGRTSAQISWVSHVWRNFWRDNDYTWC